MQLLFSWIGLGGIAFFLAVVNLILVSGGRTAPCQILTFGSLSCGILALMDEYSLVHNWVRENDMAALGDAVPWTAAMLTAACCILLIMNLITLLICLVVNQGKRRRLRRSLSDAEKRAAEAEERASAAEAKAAEGQWVPEQAMEAGWGNPEQAETAVSGPENLMIPTEQAEESE